MRRTFCRFSTLVKIGRGAENVTETASNALLEALQVHGYCYVQHPFIQKEILDQLHRDSRQFFERYILDLPPAVATPSPAGGKRPAPRTDILPMTPHELEKLTTPSGFRGYYRYVGASGVDDAIECFSVGREVPNPAELREPYYRLSGWAPAEYTPLIARPTPWEVLLEHPCAGGGRGSDTFMADYREMLLAYYDLCAAVSLDVLRHISCGLGVRPTTPQGGADPNSDYDMDFFTPFHDRCDCDLQAKYYPPLGHVVRGGRTQGVEVRAGAKVIRRKGPLAQPHINSNNNNNGNNNNNTNNNNSDEMVRLDTHKDLSTVTLLAQDALGGLEVWDDEEEKYITVPVLNDALLVNAGIFLEKWTGGLLEATPHRVRSVKDGSSRCSVVFFCLPNHDAKVEPLLQQDENPALDAQEGFYAGDLMPTAQ
ncbi:2OG-Fe(II) oxygenase [Trypanosoma theileri]|uniref:2OG-Fe(II) oxygenase n=1 Tax=Trypanosoma theileri TaxID=67003 RepID=A0A1X0NLX7_9TRYP|nr:2OG-Fe(II) oxygenase [Trypanosoma theileri]ORC85687.1 2OG-Fe(II) oxygenase [Trypanosoma theileri]